jgi:serine-type D-Ala-D-Ala carboxypeptidase/endopeptidase
MLMRFVFIFILAQKFVFSVNSSELYENLQARVDSRYNRAIGAAVVRKENTEFLIPSAFGEKSVDKDTLFEIGSITKLFTAHLAFILCEEGLLSLNIPISAYLPKGVKLPTFEGEEITLLHILTHTSGLTDPLLENGFNPINQNTEAVADYSVKELYDYLNATQLINKPGAQIHYSNLAFGLLGHIMERVSGVSYPQLLQRKIFDPLGMDHSHPTMTEALSGRVIIGTRNGEDQPYWKIKALPAFASVISTLNDLSIYLRYFFFEYSNVQNQTIKQKMLVPYLLWSEAPIASTPGWTIDKRYGSFLYIVSGTTLGCSSFMGFDPQREEGVIILTDANHMGLIGHHSLDSQFPLEKLFRYVEISQERLKMCKGTYQGPKELCNIILTVEEGDCFLTLIFEGERPVRVLSMGQNRYYFKNVEMQGIFLEFFLLESGLKQIIFHQGDEKYFFLTDKYV